eukprot:gnl/Spiro4/2785_TR1351_c0_g1_i1.p1 gnl/Spiro4/2785_TR1351_c0_g1~~gnl/Spiro4/2785_TR1351_c0_g1_i1.p1  ORF type:complete len:592 (-),score=172.05 gnl/Spiro4/2785_TR1351_c0_g1_i1:58-1782(-)
MCGILAFLGSTLPPDQLRALILRLAKRLRHRGPDWTGLHVGPQGYAIVHERLSIVDPAGGSQPLYSEDRRYVLAVNGEIFNHKALRAHNLTQQHTFATESDCEIIVHLFQETRDMAHVCNLLDGQFAFVVLDTVENTFFAARDPIGVVSLYVGWAHDGATVFSSEMKGLNEVCERFQEVPPGHYYDSRSREFVRYYREPWLDQDVVGAVVPTRQVSAAEIRAVLEAAVVKGLMCDVPYGVLLSGGLDSSLVASIAARHAERRVEDGERSKAWWPRLHTFSIGLPGSPDFAAARVVANFLGTVHHEFMFSVQEGLDAISDVIYNIETFDLTTVRASTPMFLLSRRIKAMGVKMVLSGEGSDEILGGYLYFHKAPTPAEFHRETCRKLKALHSYDCLRADKSTMAWGLEARVPFLDKDFISLMMSIDPALKFCKDAEGKPRVEKHVLRAAFDTPLTPYLPDEILWRQKEQFSDGVGYNWIDSLKQQAEASVSDEQFAQRHHRFPSHTPATKEGYYYRSIFESHFPQASARETVPGGPSVACSTAAALEWDQSLKNCVDPSGRAVAGVHVDAYKPSA